MSENKNYDKILKKLDVLFVAAEDTIDEKEQNPESVPFNKDNLEGYHRGVSDIIETIMEMKNDCS